MGEVRQAQVALPLTIGARWHLVTTTIVYSWQSDLRAAARRTLIQEAASGRDETNRRHATIDLKPVIDRDTQGLLDSPDIGAAIFAKIDRAVPRAMRP